MKYIVQTGIIFAISFLGELFHKLLPLPVPASIYGLVFLFLLLVFRVLRPESVRESGYFFIEIMPMMFIPAAVGLLESWNALRPVLLPFAVITFVTTVLVMVVSGRVTQAFLHSRKSADEGENA